MDARALADRLLKLADRMDRLRPSSHDPESYYVERDEIRRELTSLAAEVSPKRIEARAERGRFTAGAIQVDGRRVGVERRGHRKRNANGE